MVLSFMGCRCLVMFVVFCVCCVGLFIMVGFGGVVFGGWVVVGC